MRKVENKTKKIDSDLIEMVVLFSSDGDSALGVLVILPKNQLIFLVLYATISNILLDVYENNPVKKR